ncbi:hypothetical protein ACFXJ8_26355 [Nonomuraea sp. NPDC059194]|uniref:hypothetical protein n=1 Tax=Nonomuraea sp. NPDC059194 TaxID=3346764 RepID=UPI0036A5B149
MAYPEKRGNTWRVKHKLPNGKWSSGTSGFPTKQAALDWGRDQEAKIREGTWRDPNAGEIFFNTWAENWLEALDLELSTVENYTYHLRRFAIPAFELKTLNSITEVDVAAWERRIRTTHSERTAKDARTVLGICLSDAVPRHIGVNPAARKKTKGRIGQARVKAAMKSRKAVVSPLQALLVAERAASLSGHEPDFLKLITIAWTGARWSETVGMDPECVHTDHIDLYWKLYELKGKFYRGHPKDGSIRRVDLPVFLSRLLYAHLENGSFTCTCRSAEEPFCPGAEYVFLGPKRGHARRSGFSRHQFRPAADGVYPARGGKSPRPAMRVLVDATSSWPGIPLPPWPAAVRGQDFVLPKGQGVARMPERDLGAPIRHQGKAGLNSRSKKAELVEYAVAQGMPVEIASTSTREQLLDRFVRSAYTPSSAALASWMPVMPNLTPHGLRHGHQSWLETAGVKYVMVADRMGHLIPGMRGVYSHPTDEMRSECVTVLERLWEEALVARAALPPSSVPMLERLLAPYREGNVVRLGVAPRTA